MPKGNAQLTSRETLSFGIRRCGTARVANLRCSRGIVGGHRPPRRSLHQFRPEKGCRHDQRCPRHPLQRRRRGDPGGRRAKCWEPDRWTPTGGWFIFTLPPAEIAVPPTERRRPGGLYLLRDDVAATMALRPRDRAWPLSAPAPGRVKLGHSICTSVSIQRQCKLA
jgi:hypothetical protein